MILLTDNGASKYSVILDNLNASPSEQYAADELVSFVRQVTNATLTICNNNLEQCYDENKIIIVGKNNLTEKLGLDDEINLVGDEGFIIRNIGDIIIIAGGRLRGTLYGVYEFLETYLGCRWYTPDVNNIPVRDKVELPDMNIKKTPVFSIREAFDLNNFDGNWAARNKANGHHHRLMPHHGGGVNYIGVHSFDRLCPPDVYFDEHPEYFSEVNGRRIKERTQLCLTNPDVLRIVIENVRKTIKENPGCSIISVSQNDWDNYCTCEKCRKIDGEEESHMGTVLRFVNAVQETVTKEYPHVRIDTLAYTYTRKPPKITKPNPGVLIRLCSIECCFAHPLYECHVDRNEMPSNFLQDIYDWSKVSRDIYVWDYTTDFANYLLPFPNLNVLKRNLEFFRDHGVIGLFEEGAPNTKLSYAGEMRQYALAKLMYDLSLDDKLLFDEFYAGVFGPAAPYVKAFYEFWQEKSLESGEHIFGGDDANHSYHTKENVNTARNFLNKAMVLAADEATRTRIEKIALSCDFIDTVQMKKGREKDAAVDAFIGKCKIMDMENLTEWHTLEQSASAYKNQDAAVPREKNH